MGIHNNLEPAADMAGAVLRQISKNIFKKLYIQYVRPHMEFAFPAVLRSRIKSHKTKMKSNKLNRYFFKYNQQTLNKKQKIVNETERS